MSYNIDTWKTKKLELLVIPIKAFSDGTREDIHPKTSIVDAESMKVKLDCGCGQTIKGILKNGLLYVSEIDMSGEGSGFFMSECFVPALKKSTGVLEAVCVWEGGDSITRLTVNNGEVKEEHVDLQNIV